MAKLNSKDVKVAVNLKKINAILKKPFDLSKMDINKIKELSDLIGQVASGNCAQGCC